MPTRVQPSPVMSAFDEIANRLGPLNSPKTVSAVTGIPVHTLNDWRCKGKHLKFVKVGRAVYYRRDDVLDLLQSQVFSSTSEARKAHQ